MKGIIICNKCRKTMDGVCKCGNYKCLIQIYWKEKREEYRRDDQGYVFTYEKASDILIEINQKIKKGIFDPTEYRYANIVKRLFENQAEKWLEEKERRESLGELSPGTIKDYAGYVRKYFPFFEGMDVRLIGLEALTEFMDTMREVKIKTRKNIRNALMNLFRWMRERGVISEIPVFPIITGDDSKATRAIVWEVQEEALSHIPESHRDIIEFLFETGKRPGEACALLCEHIDLASGTARIERTYVAGNKIKETTKQKRKQIIPLSPRALEIARKHMAGKHPKQFLFINTRTNKGYLPKAVWYQWHKHARVDVTLYEGTRHSFGSQLIQNNDVAVVKELMGHSDIRTTQKYLHFRMAHLAEVVRDRKKVIRLLENRSGVEAK